MVLHWYSVYILSRKKQVLKTCEVRKGPTPTDGWVNLQNQRIDFFWTIYSKTEKRAAKTPFGTVDLSFGQFRTFYNSPEASLNLRKCRDVILDVFIFVEFTLLLANAF